MIEIKNLSYQYSDKKTIVFPDFACKKGEQMLVIGQSGCGKTTLLQLIGGILQVQKGEICINNTFVHTLKNSELDKFRGKNIGFILQQHYFLAALNVEENLLLAQNLAGVKEDKKAIHLFLERLNIANKAKEKPNKLSQGEQQRVAVARSLIHQPKLILADEPTSALDDNNCKQVMTLLQEQAKINDTTLLIVTHDTRLKENFEGNTLFL
jgi:ABC-type lipoprotein export system ATPase subunit